MNPKEMVALAKQKGIVIPALNIPYLPMTEPVIRAVVDENSVAMIQVARVEWEKFESQSLEAVAEEYNKYKNETHTMLHLDHVPVIDEDYQRVDYISIIKRALDAGYQSVMVDGSRLPLEENIATAKEVSDLCAPKGVACEAELGAVMGHESGEIPPYEEIFRTRKGFTIPEQAKQFAEESGCDWLSVAVGNIHGAVAAAVKDQKKPEAKLDIDHIRLLSEVTGLPLVLHGGSGINHQCIRDGIKAGIAKINVGTEIRQAYEVALRDTGDVEKAKEAVYQKTRWVLDEFLQIKNSRDILG